MGSSLIEWLVDETPQTYLTEYRGIEPSALLGEGEECNLLTMLPATKAMVTHFLLLQAFQMEVNEISCRLAEEIS